MSKRCPACKGTGWEGGGSSIVTTEGGDVVGDMVPADAPDGLPCSACNGSGEKVRR